MILALDTTADVSSRSIRAYRPESHGSKHLALARDVSLCSLIGNYFTSDPLHRPITREDVIVHMGESTNGPRYSLNPLIAAFYSVHVCQLIVYLRKYLETRAGSHWEQDAAAIASLIEGTPLSAKILLDYAHLHAPYDTCFAFHSVGKSVDEVLAKTNAAFQRAWHLRIIIAGFLTLDNDRHNREFPDCTEDHVTHATDVCSADVHMVYDCRLDHPTGGCLMARLFYESTIGKIRERHEKELGQLAAEARALTLELGIAKAHVSRLKELCSSLRRLHRGSEPLPPLLESDEDVVYKGIPRVTDYDIFGDDEDTSDESSSLFYSPSSIALPLPTIPPYDSTLVPTLLKLSLSPDSCDSSSLVEMSSAEDWDGSDNDVIIVRAEGSD